MKPPGPRLSPVGEGTRITYESLIRRHTAHLRARGRTPGGIRNALSALSGFRASAADQADELVGPEMGPFFRDRLNRYVSRLGAASSRGNARSLMNGWRREFLEMQAQAGLPQDFAGALTALFRSSGISVRKAAAAIRSRRTTLLSWMAGASWPNLRQEPKVAALEHVLGAPWGALTARLRPVRRRALEPGRTPYREKLIALKQKPYSFRPRDWPERLGEEESGRRRCGHRGARPLRVDRTSGILSHAGYGCGAIVAFALALVKSSARSRRRGGRAHQVHGWRSRCWSRLRAVLSARRAILGGAGGGGGVPRGPVSRRPGLMGRCGTTCWGVPARRRSQWNGLAGSVGSW